MSSVTELQGESPFSIIESPPDLIDLWLFNDIFPLSAAYVLLTTLVLADLFGPENFTNSFGLLLLFQGVATLAGPPTVGKILFFKMLKIFSNFGNTGYMYDAFGSYNEGFVLMGVFIALSGFMLYPIPCIRKTIKKVRVKE